MPPRRRRKPPKIPQVSAKFIYGMRNMLFLWISAAIVVIPWMRMNSASQDTPLATFIGYNLVSGLGLVIISAAFVMDRAGNFSLPVKFLVAATGLAVNILAKRAYARGGFD